MNSRSDESPSLDAMEDMARRAFAALPEEFRALTGGVSFVLTDFADAATLKAMRIANPYGLLGLYSGAPLAPRLANAFTLLPSRIYLYSEPILHFARREKVAVADAVRHVLVHEIGHHFGLSDDDMQRIENAAE